MDSLCLKVSGQSLPIEPESLESVKEAYDAYVLQVSRALRGSFGKGAQACATSLPGINSLYISGRGDIGQAYNRLKDFIKGAVY